MGQTISSVGAATSASTRTAGDQRRKKQSRLGAQIKAVTRTEIQTEQKNTSASSTIENSQNLSISSSNKVGKNTWISVAADRKDYDGLSVRRRIRSWKDQ
jgi:hypothetical protein